MRCPGCKVELVSLPYLCGDGTMGTLLCHPETVENNCRYKYDGVEINVVDQLLQNKFIELIKEENSKSLKEVFKKWGKRIFWKF